jgi:hypothetical protein
MAEPIQANYHDIKTLTSSIHEHMELVCAEMSKTEKSYLERGYKFTWDGLSTWTGLHDLGMTGGFTTRLRYWVSLFPTDEELNK